MLDSPEANASSALDSLRFASGRSLSRKVLAVGRVFIIRHKIYLNSMDTQTIQEIQRITQEFLSKLGIEANSVVELGESEIVQIKVSPKNSEESLGILIGYHGETLNAIQTILSLIANRGREKWIRILVDVDDYRVKHSENLKALVLRTVEKARFLKEPVALLPMSAFDRRIVHLVVSEFEDMESASMGEDPERRVIIKPVARDK